MSEDTDQKHPLEKTLDWVLEKWYVWLSIIGLIYSGFKFYFQLQGVIDHQNNWEVSSQQRRKDSQNEMAQFKQETQASMAKFDKDLAVTKNDVEWLKKGK
jgi:hypothetical protein